MQNTHLTSRFLDCLNHNQITQPIWMFRQAGRYLPEYRKLRQQQSDFLKFCYTPDLCIEAVMQPIRRFDLDAAIVFSDILVIPDALGQDVWFEGGIGPKLKPLSTGNLTKSLSIDRLHQHLDPVYQGISGKLDKLGSVPLIGFSGSVWTLACYMIEGQGSRDYFSARKAAIQDPSFNSLVTLLESAISQYLIRQIAQGVQAVQLFDSWAGVLSPQLFEKYVIAPTARIVANIHQVYPDFPVMGFARGCGEHNKYFTEKTGVRVTTLDETSPIDEFNQQVLNKTKLFQGNLDPAYLLGSQDQLQRAVEDWKQKTYGIPWLYNLGHGIHKDTDPAMVEKMLYWLRRD